MPDGKYCVTLLSGLVLVAFVFVMRFLPEFLVWTGWQACGPGACTIQGWLGATSGWAGFGAAAVTAYFIFGQMREARTQTRFTLGDAPPTIQMAENVKELGVLQIRIVNWNRRQLIIDAIEVLNAGDGASIARITFALNRSDEPWSRRNPDALVISPSVSVRGWENRNLQPPYLKIACTAHSPSNIVRIRIHCRQVAEQTCKVILNGSCELTARG